MSLEGGKTEIVGGVAVLKFKGILKSVVANYASYKLKIEIAGNSDCAFLSHYKERIILQKGLPVTQM
jgi:hypothetical protein